MATLQKNRYGLFELRLEETIVTPYWLDTIDGIMHKDVIYITPYDKKGKPIKSSDMVKLLNLPLAILGENLIIKPTQYEPRPTTQEVAHFLFCLWGGEKKLQSMKGEGYKWYMIYGAIKNRFRIQKKEVKEELSKLVSSVF